jgi:hypothetical protein
MSGDPSKFNGARDHAPDPRLVRAENDIQATRADVRALDEKMCSRLDHQDEALKDIRRMLTVLVERKKR